MHLIQYLSTPRRIAFLGGSSVLQRAGYTYQLMLYLDALLSRQAHRFSKYALGTCPSLFACYQQSRYSISEKNDVVFIDFCPNDRNIHYFTHTLTLDTIERSVEGLLISLFMKNPNCLPIIIDRVSHFDDQLERVKDEACSVSLIYKKLADHYGLPVLPVTKSIMETQGVEFLKQLNPPDDPNHPSQPAGTKFVAATIMNLMRPLELPLRQLSPVIRQNSYVKLAVLDGRQLKKCVRGDFTTEKLENSAVKESILRLRSKAVLRFQLKGELNGLYFWSTPQSGYITIRMGKQVASLSLYSDQIEQRKGICRFINLDDLGFSTTTRTLVQIYLCRNTKPPNHQHRIAQVEPPASIQDWEWCPIALIAQGELLPDSLSTFPLNFYSREIDLA